MSKNIVYPYIPNSEPTVKKEMMKYVGVETEDELFEEIPSLLRCEPLSLPDPILDEYSIKRHTEEILKNNKNCNDYASFLGAGCARHYSPAVCDDLLSRGEFLTSYTGTQYCDHGKFQIFFEFQSLICALVGMEFTTTPCHDGAQAAATALCMSNRMTGRKKVLLPASMNPDFTLVIENYLASLQEEKSLDIEYIEFDVSTGLIDIADLKRKLDSTVAGVLIENPNFLGNLEINSHEIGKLVRDNDSEFIVYVDPISMGVMDYPRNYGATIVCGDVHSLGLHLSSGGAHAGFIAVPDDMRYISETKDMVYSLTPTIDGDGSFGFARALFERTHYSEREKGKEFTGTNSNLWTLPVAAYLSMMGPEGMREIGETIMTNALYGATLISQIPNVKLRFEGVPFFKEFVVDFSGTEFSVSEINKALMDKGVFGGYDLSPNFTQLEQCSLYCITEITTEEEIDLLVRALTSIVA